MERLDLAERSAALRDEVDQRLTRNEDPSHGHISHPRSKLVRVRLPVAQKDKSICAELRIMSPEKHGTWGGSRYGSDAAGSSVRGGALHRDADPSDSDGMEA
ncbi:hypothetical protein JCM18237_08200 [Halorubrum luteum]